MKFMVLIALFLSGAALCALGGPDGNNATVGVTVSSDQGNNSTSVHYALTGGPEGNNAC